MESSPVVEEGNSILYVEDEPDAREMISATLVAEYPVLTVYVAENGARGLELFREHRPDLVLTDIRMPVMDGIRMAEEIKAIDPDAIIIAVTAYSDTSYLLHAIESGLSEYLLKPVSYRKLFSIIEKNLGVVNLKRRVNRQNVQILELAGTLEERVRERTRELYRLNRLYVMLSKNNQAIARTDTREKLLSEVCRNIVAYGGFKRACVGVPSPETGVVRPIATAGDVIDGCICLEGDLSGAGPVTTALREQSYFVSNECEPESPARQLCSKAWQGGCRSNAAFALKMNGDIAGVLNISADEPDFFDTQMIDLLNQMTADISVAMENMETEVCRREAETALRDETIKKLQAIEDLRTKEQLLLQRNRQAAMGELMVNISHHWRQPLNVLGLMVQELTQICSDSTFSRERLEERVREAMGVILKMSATIDGFSTLYESGGEWEQFSLKEIVEKTVALFRAGVNSENFTIEMDVENDVAVSGLANEYSQVLLNILLNAREIFVERGTASPRISVKLFPERDNAVLTISDNAGGIPENDLERVFDPYFTTKDPDQGSGLGLYMAKTIIEKHMSGRLQVYNTARGAEFRIEVRCGS